jgi:hypothetical protein
VLPGSKGSAEIEVAFVGAGVGGAVTVMPLGKLADTRVFLGAALVVDTAGSSSASARRARVMLSAVSFGVGTRVQSCSVRGVRFGSRLAWSRMSATPVSAASTEGTGSTTRWACRGLRRGR